jgi:hypothetical protein
MLDDGEAGCTIQTMKRTCWGERRHKVRIDEMNTIWSITCTPPLLHIGEWYQRK